MPELFVARCENAECPEAGFGRAVAGFTEHGRVHLLDDADGECTACKAPCEITRS